ncbi:uncharacterized protein LOC118185616 [Stegodyphus dumicola]|uniref:uncharacterized protein LOC118185616 n=1 Tax=Stegodyphus dumicola TaxID=202533 RepID=UPI0015A88EDD|nr:uncharacterized protein LOC118185616 [Stegodyphus dumicola]
MQHVLRRPRPRMHRKRDESHSQNIYYPKTEMNITGQFHRLVSPVEIKAHKLMIAKTWNYTLPIKKKKSNLMEKTNLFNAPQEVKIVFLNDLRNDSAFNNLLGNREINTALGNLTDNLEQIQSIKVLEKNSVVDLLSLHNNSAKIKFDITTPYATDSAKNVKGVNETNRKNVRFVAVHNWIYNERKQDSMNVSEKYQLHKNIVGHVSNGTSHAPEYTVTTLTKSPVVQSISLSSNAINRSSAGQILDKVSNRSKATDRTSTLHSRDASSNVYFNKLDQKKGQMILQENPTHISTVGSIILLEPKGVHLLASNGENLNNVNEGFNFSKYHLFQNSTERTASNPPNISTSLNKLHVLSSTTLSADTSNFKEKINHGTITPYSSETSKKVKDTYNVQSTNIRMIPVDSFKQISTTESIISSEPKYFLFIKHNKENVNDMQHNHKFSSYQLLQNATKSDNNSFAPRFDLAISQNLHVLLSTAVSSSDVMRNATENLSEGNADKDRTAMYGNSTKIDDFAITSHVRNLTSNIIHIDDAEKKNVRGLFLHNSTSFLNENITASGSNCTLLCIYKDREIETLKENNHFSKFHPFQNYSVHTLSSISFMPKFQLTPSNNLRNVTMFFSNVKKKIDSEERLSTSRNKTHEFFQTIAPNITLRSLPISLIIRKQNSSEHMQLSTNESGELSQSIKNVLYHPTEIYSTKNKTSSIFLNKEFQFENNMQKTTVANDIPYMKNRKEVYFTTLMGELAKTRKLKREFKMTDGSQFETFEQTERYDRPSFYETEQNERIRKQAPMSLLKDIKYADNHWIEDKMSQNKIIFGGKSKIIKRGNTKTFQSPLQLRKHPIFVRYTNGKKFSDWQNSMNAGNIYHNSESLYEGRTQYPEQELISAYNDVPEAAIV